MVAYFSPVSSHSGGGTPVVRAGQRMRPAMALAALGVVFGDIGTSPLYALQAAFSLEHGAARPSPADVVGIVSMILWALVLVVSVKYVGLVMRADNDGEGGIIALASLARRAFPRDSRRSWWVLVAGMVGAALFYGDGVITPAISVLSAVEGVRVVAPTITDSVPLIAAVVVAVLFLAQSRGTARIGRAFGPVMGLWFLTLAALGLPHVWARPEVLTALLPTTAASYILTHPATAFLVLGAVVLAVTGAEALYADMGHFGASAIRTSWAAVVLPSLVLVYLGQAALLLGNPQAVSDPFFLLAPAWARIPLVVMATAATVIASQAVITGAFSMTQQAIRTGLLPRMLIRHTSEAARGQIYVPVVNALLFGGVLVLIFSFRSSERLSAAYGLAVTGTFLVTTTLLVVVARHVWRWPAWWAHAVLVAIGVPELVLLGANTVKLLSGGWLPVLLAAVVLVVMTTWWHGRREVVRRRRSLAGELAPFLDSPEVAHAGRPAHTAVFLHAHPNLTPLALRENVLVNCVLHRHTVLVSVLPVPVPHVAAGQRVAVEEIQGPPGLSQVLIRQGFMDSVDVPSALRQVLSDQECSHATFFVSDVTVVDGGGSTMAGWRRKLFIRLSQWASDPSDWFHLPPRRTVVVGTQIDL